jgi:hypothetical protein
VAVAVAAAVAAAVAVAAAALLGLATILREAWLASCCCEQVCKRCRACCDDVVAAWLDKSAIAACVAAGAFQGCAHGQECRRCLAAAALQHHLGISLAFPISMSEEPWLATLAQLDDEQLFAVAAVVLVTTTYIAARRRQIPMEAVHLHLSAAAGCGKTTVLNVAS